MPPPVFRFAPSPNGYLHLGHALSALLNADMARAGGGRLLLRIEDIAARAGGQAIYQDLAWLGSLRAAGAAAIGLAISCGAPGSTPGRPIEPSRAGLPPRPSVMHGPWPRDPDGCYPGAVKSLARRCGAWPRRTYALRLDAAARRALSLHSGGRRSGEAGNENKLSLHFDPLPPAG
jgi:glutamyl-Q tRNA(Asp) synthetase